MGLPPSFVGGSQDRVIESSVVVTHSGFPGVPGGSGKKTKKLMNIIYNKNTENTANHISEKLFSIKRLTVFRNRFSINWLLNIVNILHLFTISYKVDLLFAWHHGIAEYNNTT